MVKWLDDENMKTQSIHILNFHGLCVVLYLLLWEAKCAIIEMEWGNFMQ